MKSINAPSEFNAITARVNKLTPAMKPLWGQMTVHEMICHASDQIRDILGVRSTPLLVPEEMRQQVIQMVMIETEWDRGLPTFPPYSQAAEGGGTRPTDFTRDKNVLLQLLEKFHATTDATTFHSHAGLGVLSREQFGQFVWKHTDHHLRQFGV